MIDSDWLWVKSLKDDSSGLVPKALTEVLVSEYFLLLAHVFYFTYITIFINEPYAYIYFFCYSF